MTCHHCNRENIEKLQFYNEQIFPHFESKIAFCNTICLIAGMMDDMIHNPKALTHIDKESWIPVLQQFHDAILK